MKNPDKGELHLLVIWANARHKEKEIIEDIKKNLTIVGAYDILWTPDLVKANFSRFYGVKLEDSNYKMNRCGKDRFLLLTLWDPSPSYGMVETSRGHEIVNERMFGLKSRYRAWTGGGDKIHATNSPEETNHDITLLLGKNTEDYLKSVTAPWSGEAVKLQQDLPGAVEWQDLTQLFYVLNNTCKYLVLRNHECLPKAFSTKEHGDIDILVTHQSDAALLLNAQKVHKIPYRVHYRNRVAGNNVYWDIRSLGDNYYCFDWEKNMFKDRVLNEHGIYIQSDENYFYSLVYHAAIHKKLVASDYFPRMQALFDKLPNAPSVDFSVGASNLDAFYPLLLDYMRKHYYTFTRPVDYSVYYNESVLSSPEYLRKLSERFDIEDLRIVRINMAGQHKLIFIRGKYDNKDLFFKWGADVELCTKEYRCARALYEIIPDHVVEPVMYRADSSVCFVATEYTDAPNLETYLAENDVPQSVKDSFIAQLLIMAKALESAGIVHRDIRPANILVTKDLGLKLIDFEFAVKASKYREPKKIRKTPSLIQGLGGTYALGKYKWDDMYSFAKMMRELGATEQSHEALKYVTSRIGSMTISFRRRALVLALRRACKILSTFVPVKKWRKALRSKY